jgi:hypothetical protein
MRLLLGFDPIGLVRRKSGPAGDAVESTITTAFVRIPECT